MSRRTGRPPGRPPGFARPAFDRLMERVERQSSGCLVYAGYCNPKGYGWVRSGSRSLLAHRVVWEHHNGPIPDGLVVRHSCDNPPCVEIDHLAIGTHAENSADMVSRGRAPVMRGERSGKARLTQVQVDEIRRLAAASRPLCSIADEFSVGAPHICRIVSGERWPK